MVRLSQEYPTTMVPICLSQGFYSCTTSWPRSKLGRKGFIQLTLLHCCSSQKEVRTGTQASQEAGADAEAHGGMFLTGLLPLACSACSLIEPKNTSPGMVPLTRDPPRLITNWENAPQLDLVEALPQLKLLSSVVTPACVKLTHKTSLLTENYSSRCLIPHYEFLAKKTKRPIK